MVNVHLLRVRNEGGGSSGGGGPGNGVRTGVAITARDLRGREGVCVYVKRGVRDRRREHRRSEVIAWHV